MARKRRGNGEGSITQRKSGLWQAEMSLGMDPATGTVKRITFYGTTRADVAAKLAEAIRDKAHGVLVAPARLTLGAWLDTWLDVYKKPAVRVLTYQSYQQQIRTHILPALGHIVLQDLRTEHLQRVYNHLSEQGYSARTVRYVHVTLKAALALAEKHQKLARNPALWCTLPRTTRQTWPTLTPAQAQVLFPVLARERLGALFVVACCTGLRRGELLGLRWQDVELDRRRLHVRQTAVRIRVEHGTRKTQVILQPPKTPTSHRTLPLPGLCVQAFRTHRAMQAQERLQCESAYRDNDLVFCREWGEPMDPKWVNRSFDRILKHAGLSHMRVHDLRHTFATLLMEQGESPKTVSQLLGHANTVITLDWYTHPSDEVRQDAIDRLNAQLGG